MESRLIIAGFGGQGIMMIGQLLCYTAIDCDKQALFLPHYGPEQRGGTANCTVTISDEPIGSPIVKKIDLLIAMNQPSLVKFADRVREGGIILANSSLCTELPQASELRVMAIPADSLAESLGSSKVANILMLAACSQVLGLFTEQELIATVEKKLARKPEFLEMNKNAVRAGMQAV